MKSLISILFFAAILIGITPRSEATDSNGCPPASAEMVIKWLASCYNLKYCCSCGVNGEGFTVEFVPKNSACKDGMSESCSSGNSIVNNLNGRYRHFAWDYSVELPGASSTCAPCGGFVAAPSPNAILPSFAIQRVFSPDNVFPTSFGRHWGWNGDLWLTLYSPGNIPDWIPQQNDGWVVEVSQPTSEPLDAFTMIDPEEDGTFTDPEKAHAQDIRFYDATSTLVTDPSLATTAELRTFTGERLVFELYTESTIGGQLTGRILYFADRNDERMTWAWKYAVDDITLIGSLRTKLSMLDHVTDAYGRTAEFTYDETAQHSGNWVVTRIDLPNGEHLEYEYGNFLDPHGETVDTLIGVNHPDGTVSTFDSEFDANTSCLRWFCNDPAAAPLSRIKTNLFSMLVWHNPEDSEDVRPQVWGRLRESRNGLGEQVYASFIADFTQPDNSIVAHSYVVDHGRMFGIEHIGGDKPTAVYYREDFSGDMVDWLTLEWGTGWVLAGTYGNSGPRNSVSSYTDAHGHTTSWDRNSTTVAATETTFPDETTETITYNTFVQPLTVTDRLGRTTTYTYDTNGNRLTMTKATGTTAEATWEWEYNARGLVTAAIDANGHRTEYGYSTAGYLTSVTQPGDRTEDDPSITQYAYDSAGRRTSTTDASNRVISYEYDERNRLIDTEYGDSSHETVEYGDNGDENLVVARVDRDGSRTEYQYDNVGRLTATIVGVGTGVAMTTSLTYRAGSDAPLTENRAGDLTEFGYDARMRRSTIVRHTAGSTALTDTSVYDAVGLKSVTTDPYGRRTAMVYDVNDRLTRTVRELIPSGYGSGNPTTLTRVLTANPAYVIAEVFNDAEGQVTARIDGRGTVTNFGYDAQGRLTTQVEAYGTSEAAITAMTYDEQGNLLTRRTPRQRCCL